MGVPVVTLTGDRHAGRVGYSLLWSIGFAEWAARGQQQFIEIAAGLAADPERLAGIRKKLRNIMAGAQLCDMKSFSDSVENAYRGMWHVWCDSQ